MLKFGFNSGRILEFAQGILLNCIEFKVNSKGGEVIGFRDEKVELLLTEAKMKNLMLEEELLLIKVEKNVLGNQVLFKITKNIRFLNI